MMPPTIQSILGRELYSGQAYKEKERHRKVMLAKKERLRQLQMTFPKGAKQPRIEYMKQIEKRPDFRRELDLMKNIISGKSRH